MALLGMPALSSAQSGAPAIAPATAPANAGASMPRLSLPVAPENYPADAYIANEEGSVVLIATIGTDGQLSNARVETSSGHLSLDEASIALANSARLPTPPTNAAGEPVRVDVLVDVLWVLPAQPSRTRSAASAAGPADLPLDPTSAFALAYFRPGANFSGYDKFVLEGPEIAFREGWHRQHLRATPNDEEQIKRTRAAWFRDALIDELRDRGGYQFVDQPGPGVLIIRAGIGDLDVAAPFLASDIDPGYSLSEGGTTATLILELFDAGSGEVLARLFDRQQEVSANFDMPATRYSNERDARVIFAGWAEKLRARLEADR